LNGIAQVLVTVTGLVAGMANAPEIRLEREEAVAFTDAGSKLMAHYGLGAMSETAELWFNFAMVSGAIIAPRVVAYKMRKFAETNHVA
jgi:hypothetical protein